MHSPIADAWLMYMMSEPLYIHKKCICLIKSTVDWSCGLSQNSRNPSPERTQSKPLVLDKILKQKDCDLAQARRERELFNSLKNVTLSPHNRYCIRMSHYRKVFTYKVLLHGLRCHISAIIKRLYRINMYFHYLLALSV